MIWNSINDAPRDGTCILGFSNYWTGKPKLSICYWDEEFSLWATFDEGSLLQPGPTHWMPLPEPPEVG